MKSSLSPDVRDLDLGRVPVEFHGGIRHMRDRHSEMWSGRLGDCVVAINALADPDPEQSALE